MGEWLTKRPGWMKDYAQPTDRAPLAGTDRPLVETDNNTVTHIPIRCPKCKSRRVKCRGTSARPVLYYGCLDCKYKFKVLEVE